MQATRAAGCSGDEISVPATERVGSGLELKKALAPFGNILPIGQHSLAEGVHMSDDELRAELERLRAENEALKAEKKPGLSLKVSQKGAVSLYGLGRWPVTLYKEQWLSVLEMAEEIRAFIAQNESKLKTRD
jgi:hypothetical protein